ncbi:ROK family transcriptional regulator [Actinacidiphila paucisporea]|uniref:Sugar kinase of the NBD/HSP70 family, may contain an N-terminal HTH domain n=1 Tax=Actinacidiphila paucisporea TaxID=310782 RepID=A0A1M7PRV2_9ACTN|nr:ROK family transcriptional regulator [Actinacidiphila paucisporea]SHN20149.1 Sugar kinase of the NBD/HSP70 family, may contain an N-terminal HTH domain [Actinacidiphila paucisporea]
MHTPPGVTIDTPVNLREVGRLRVLEALHATQRSSRPELVRVTGLSRATVSSLVADLIAVGLVTEEEPDADDPEPRRTGRPAQSLSLVPTAGYAIGADIGHQHVRVNLCDLFGTVLWEHWVAKDVDRAPEETLDLVAVLVGRALQETGVARARVLGIGAGIASPVEKGSGELGAEGIMPGWVGLHLTEELRKRTALPVRVTNDANAGALAELMYGAGRQIGDMVYVRLSAGIGAGIVSNGQLLLGARGLAGELGHLPLIADGLICRCGNRGCLETVASPVAIARLLTQSWGRHVAARDLPGLIRQRNTGALRAVRDAGDAVGRALSTLVTLLNPRLIVVGGDLASAGEDLLEPLRAGVRRHTLPSAARGVEIVTGGLGDGAEVRGAAGLVLAGAPHLLSTTPPVEVA